MNATRALAAIAGLVTGCTACSTAPTHRAQGPLYPIGCAETVSYASQDGGQPFVLELVNERDELVQVYWIDYEGEEILKGGIAPGESWSQNTYLSHPWVVRTQAGECLAAYANAPRTSLAIR